MLYHSVSQLTTKKLSSLYLAGMFVVFNPECLKMWIKNLENKLSSIPKILKVAIVANSVSYPQKNFYPHTWREWLSFVTPNAQKCEYKIWKIKQSSILKILELNISAFSEN